MVYALVACVVALSLGLLLIAHAALDRHNEVANQLLIDVPRRMEYLAKILLDAATQSAATANESAAQAAVAIARAILTPQAVEPAEGATGVVSTDAYETMEYPLGGLADDIAAFYGEKDVAETLTDIEAPKYDPDAEKFDPMADEWTRTMFYGTADEAGSQR